MQAKIEIVHVVQFAGTSRKTGKDYDIRNAQCVVRDADPVTGQVKPKIGVLSLPSRFNELPKGIYMVDFEATIGPQGRIVSEVADVKQWDGASVKGTPRKVLVEVLSVTPHAGFSKRTLKDYDMLFADCLVHKVDRDTGDVALLVGELLVPDRYKDISPGMYEVEFEIAIGQDKRIGGRVADITPVKPAVVISSAPAPVAAPPGVAPLVGKIPDVKPADAKPSHGKGVEPKVVV